MKGKWWKHLITILAFSLFSCITISTVVSCTSTNVNNNQIVVPKTTNFQPVTFPISVSVIKNSKITTLTANNGKYLVNYGDQIKLVPSLPTIPYAHYQYQWTRNSLLNSSLPNATNKDLITYATSDAIYELKIINQNNPSQYLMGNAVMIRLNNYELEASLNSNQMSNNELLLTSNDDKNTSFNLVISEVVNKKVISLSNKNTAGTFSLYGIPQNGKQPNLISECTLINLNNTNWTFTIANQILRLYSSIYAVININQQNYQTQLIKIKCIPTNKQILDYIYQQLTNNQIINATKIIGNINIVNQNVGSDLMNYFNHEIRNGFIYDKVVIASSLIKFSNLTLNEQTNSATITLNYQSLSTIIKLNHFYLAPMDASTIVDALCKQITNNQMTLNASKLFPNVRIANNSLTKIISLYLANLIPSEGMKVNAAGYLSTLVKQNEVTYQIIANLAANEVKVNVTYTNQIGENATASILINNFALANLSNVQIMNALVNNLAKNALINANAIPKLKGLSITNQKVSEIITDYLLAKIGHGIIINIPGYYQVKILSNTIKINVAIYPMQNEAMVQLQYPLTSSNPARAMITVSNFSKN